MKRTITLGLAVVAGLVIAAPASADPINANTVTRTLECDNGRTVETVFAGENGSNFNATTDQSVFIYSQIIIDRLPLGVGGDDETTTRGLQGQDQGSLVTCDYTTPSGNHVTVIGFFTPRK